MTCEIKDAEAELVDTAARSLERLVNGGGEDNRNILINRLCSMHRTLQQKLIGEIVIPIVRTMAGRMQEQSYDERNRCACEACAAMLDGLAAKFPYIAKGDCNLSLI